MVGWFTGRNEFRRTGPGLVVGSPEAVLVASAAQSQVKSSATLACHRQPPHSLTTPPTTRKCNSFTGNADQPEVSEVSPQQVLNAGRTGRKKKLQVPH